MIYHGKKDWVKRDFASYFKLPDERLKRYLPFFEYELVDLTKIADELIKDVNIGYFLRSTFLLFKHKDDLEYVKRESEEIFIFVQQKLNKYQKTVLIKSILIYIAQAFKFDTDQFIAYTKTLPKMVEYVPGSVYDQITKRIQKENEAEVTMLKAELKRLKGLVELGQKKKETERKKKAAALKKKELAQKKVAAIASLTRLLDSFILMPKLSLAKTARVTGIKLHTVKQVKATLVNDTLLISRKKINQLFFGEIKLSSLEVKKINQLIKECRSELKKTIG